MPTTRFGKVRRMLKSSQAKVVRTKPFTIRHQYEPETHVVQKVVFGIDPGRTNTGACTVREDGTASPAAHIRTRNKDVRDRMKDRNEHRQAPRRGGRLARKRLAKKHGTRTDKWNPRILPGYEDPVPVKDIRNTESRFMNRRWPDGSHRPRRGFFGCTRALRHLCPGCSPLQRLSLR